MSSGRSDQLQPPNVSSGRSDQLQPPDVSRGRRAYHSNPLDEAANEGLSLRPSARAACEGLNHSAAAAFPRGPPFGLTRAEGLTSRFLGRETLEKPETASIITAPETRMEALWRPAAKSLPFMALLLHERVLNTYPQHLPHEAARYLRHSPSVTNAGYPQQKLTPGQRPTRVVERCLSPVDLPVPGEVAQRLLLPAAASCRAPPTAPPPSPADACGPSATQGPWPRFGCASFSSRHSAMRGHAAPNTASSSSAGSRVTRSGYSRQGAALLCVRPLAAFAVSLSS